MGNKRVEVYYNLHKHVLSVRQRGLVIMHTPTVELEDVVFSVQPAGRNKVIKENRKNVHAFVRGNLVNSESKRIEKSLAINSDNWRLVTYNPYKYESFVYSDNEKPIHSASRVIVVGRSVWVQMDSCTLCGNFYSPEEASYVCNDCEDALIEYERLKEN
jgi:hypothetical protein